MKRENITKTSPLFHRDWRRIPLKVRFDLSGDMDLPHDESEMYFDTFLRLSEPELLDEDLARRIKAKRETEA